LNNRKKVKKMATLEHYRRQLDHGEDLHGIVKTMKAMAAVTIRQYEQVVEAINQYHDTVFKAMHILMKRHPEILPELKSENGAENIGAIILGSEIGMCGQFNEDIADFALKNMDRIQEDSHKRKIVTLGLRVSGLIQSQGQAVKQEMELPGSVHSIKDSVQSLIVFFENWRTKENMDHILIYYNEKQSGSSYDQKEIHLWPPDLKEWQALVKKPWPAHCLPLYRSELDKLIAATIQQSVFVTIYQAFAESLASENASRLAAMQAAEKNIQEHLDEVRTQYNHERQSSITSELMDIISGFEALKES